MYTTGQKIKVKKKWSHEKNTWKDCDGWKVVSNINNWKYCNWWNVVSNNSLTIE